MKIRCAIFDFDGTLFDSMSVWDSVGEVYLRSLGIEPRPSLREDIRAMSLYQSACYFRREYKLSLSSEEIIKGIDKIIEHFYFHDVLPKSGVLGFLHHIKTAKIPMCIATATDRYQIEAALRRCGMEQYFEKIFTCSETGHGKDEPYIFRTAMEHFGADRSTTLIFEDAFHAIRTAKADGFKVVAVFDKSEKHQKEIHDLADFCLTDFDHTDGFWKFASAL
ncbi:MAG: HAD family phosphatase [Christensenellaceae bacterium]|nr:HAD family phosphatase [Christensenellaceae bacterium]